MNQTRTYTMRARAASVEDTRRRIVQATFDLGTTRLVSDISLQLVAAEAGVSVQTVLRHFGNRAGLLEAAGEHGSRLVAVERAAPAGDVAEAVRVVVDHYERRGDSVMMMLAQETSEPMIRRVTDRGRATHRTWVEEVFAPLLDERPRGTPRAAMVDLLVVATDLYTWKLLRRDRRLSRSDTEARMVSLVTAVLAGPSAGRES